MSDRITIPVPDNWHCHLREGPMMHFMVDRLLESGFYGRVLAMPNTQEPLLSGILAKHYESKIFAILKLLHLTMIDQSKFRGFAPVVTIQITEETTPEVILEAHQIGVRAAKVYPRNVTTNSHHGVLNYREIYKVLKVAEEYGMVVCFHPELPDEEIEGMAKESLFIATLREIRSFFPKLKIVVEHVSTREMVKWVRSQPVGLVGATLTPQHLFLTIDDVIGYSPRSGYRGEVHHMCKPTLKLGEDRKYLQKMATSGDPHFFYGGDDAPHPKSNKECAKCACGVFNTTVALPVLATVFEAHNALDKLADFTSGFGAEFYGYPRNTDTIILVKNSWQVPLEYPVFGTGSIVGHVVPMLAGETLEWQISS